MKSVFLVKRIKGERCVTTIRQKSSRVWFYFKVIHYPIKEHNWRVKKAIGEKVIAHQRQVEVNLVKPEAILEYLVLLQTLKEVNFYLEYLNCSDN